MLIKKYQGASETEAIIKAKEELGSNAIVLNMKTIKHMGIIKLLKKDYVEITAALEEEHNKNINIAAPSALQNKIEKKAFIDAFADEAIKISPAVYPKANTQTEDSRVLKEKLTSIQNLLEQQITTDTQKISHSASQEEEKNEINTCASMIYHTLLDNEVDEKYANVYMNEIERRMNKDKSIDSILAHVYQKMILKLGKPSLISEAKKKPKVVFFIGPTGVGKTTTLAKIASKFRVEDCKNLAMITADTYRIAATEQLKTYANILGVAFQIIYSPDELPAYITKQSSCDYILVDTAGHSHVNEEQRKDVKNLINSLPDSVEKDIFLVISATTKYKDLIKIIDTYQDIENYKIIITKLDETTSLGNILNIKMYSGRDLSYLTTGQNVPDDIEVFNPQDLVKKLLGGTS